MARPLRIQYPGAYYQVTCRGNERKDIFRTPDDRDAFLEKLALSAEIYNVSVHAYVLMTSHFHLLLSTPEGNLAEFMRHFNISYTAFFNRRYNRVGHLYQGRYKAFLIDADNYLLEVSRYIHINPIRLKKFKKKPEKERLEALRGFEDSSFAGYCNVRKRDDFINYGTVLAYVGGDNRQGRQACRKFVQEGIGLELENPLEKGKGNGIVDVDDGTSYNPPVKIKVLSGKAMKHSGVSKSIDFWANHSSPELCSGSGKKLDESLTSL